MVSTEKLIDKFLLSHRIIEVLIGVSVFLLFSYGTYSILNNIYSNPYNFQFKSLSVVEIKGRKMMKLHRTMDKTLIGDFFVEVSPAESSIEDVPSCTAVASPDLFSKKDKPFISRLFERFSDFCLENIKPGKYRLAVEYHLNGKIFGKTTFFNLCKENIKNELNFREKKNDKLH